MHNCRACQSNHLSKILDLGQQPLAGGFLAEDASPSDLANESKYPLTLYFCEQCYLLQISHVIPANQLYSQYSFASSTIEYLVSHFRGYADWLVKRFQPKSILEFGCNDGVLLAPLMNLGVECVGIDISENITDLAKQKGLNVITGTFNRESAKQIIASREKVDIVTGSNCFAHNDDLATILDAVRHSLKSSGHLCLEVMYGGSLLDKLQWDSIYHEHLSYFSLTTLQKLLSQFGFNLIYAEINEMHAGSLRIAASLDPNAKVDHNVHKILQHEQQAGLLQVDTWKTFADTVTRQIHTTQEVMQQLSKGAKICAYGASGRASLWLNLCKMNYIDYIVDASPLRAGKLLPGIHAPIVYPEHLKKAAPDYIFVPAWNYLQSIMQKEQWFKGIWCSPNPSLNFI